MNAYKFHRNEKQVKDVLTNERYDNELIVESLRANYQICNDFYSLDIQRELFKMMCVDNKFDTLEDIWNSYDKKYGNGQQEFKNFDEFADAVKYVDLETMRSIYQSFSHYFAVAIKNNRVTQENALKVKCLEEEKYLKQLETEGDDTAFEEFCACLNIDYDNMTEEQIEIVGKFFKNTMLYAESLVKKEEIEFIKRYIPYIAKLENKLKDRFLVKVEDLKNLIMQYNSSAKLHNVYDELTDKNYYVVDLGSKLKFKSDAEVLDAAIKGKGPLMFLGGVSDKISAISGKTICDSEKPSYALDINLMTDEYMKFYLPFLNHFITGVNFKDYKGYVNDLIEWGPIFVGFSDFNKYVNKELLTDMDKDKIATKIGILLKDNNKLENYLKKLALSYRKMIDKMYQKTIAETKKYSNIVSKYKPEEFIPFEEF